MSRPSLAIIPRRWALPAFAGLLLVLLAARVAPARAFDPDAPNASVEVLVEQPLTAYSAPDPTSSIQTRIDPGNVIDVIGRQLGTDGAMWLNVGMVDGESLGWVRQADFRAGTTFTGMGDFGMPAAQ